MDEDDSVILVVEKQNYEFSKRKLCEHSEYFNAMFNGGFSEKTQKIVKLEGIATTSCEHVMYYIKNGRIKPHQTEEQEKKDRIKEIIRLLQDSTMLQFINIQEKCSRILYDTLDSSNAIEILEVASQLDLSSLIHKARIVALWYADDISASDAFYMLGIDQVEGLLSDPALHSSSGEWGAWEAIDRWINFSLDATETRRTHLQRLLKCLHLDSLSSSDLKGIGLYDYVRSDPVVSEAMRIIIDERSNKNRDDSDCVQNLTKGSADAQVFLEEWKQTGPRKLPFVPALVANVKIDEDTTTHYIVRFSESEKKFSPTIRLTKVETDIGCYVGYKVIAQGSKLYLFGGEVMARQGTWNHAIWEYDQIHTEWKFLTNILKPSRHLSGCRIGDDLYILGGFGRHRVIQDGVHKFSIKDESWTPCAPLPRPMYSVPCCVFKEQIYVIESVVYQYSPNRDTWITLDIVLPTSKTIFNSAMANNSFIYLTGAFTKIVYKFDPSIPQTTLEKVGTFKNDCSQACLIDEYIYSLSQDEFGEEICCEKLNVKTGENLVIWEGIAGEGNDLANLDPKHHHGCFPFLFE